MPTCLWILSTTKKILWFKMLRAYFSVIIDHKYHEQEGQYCCVSLCCNASGGSAERKQLGSVRVSFHSFPNLSTDKERAKEWIVRIWRDSGSDFVLLTIFISFWCITFKKNFSDVHTLQTSSRTLIYHWPVLRNQRYSLNWERNTIQTFIYIQHYKVCT